MSFSFYDRAFVRWYCWSGEFSDTADFYILSNAEWEMLAEYFTME